MEPIFINPDCPATTVFTCSVCLDFPTDPVVTPCHHIFCRPCIYQVLQLCSECPNDRGPLTLCQLKDIDGPLKRIWEQTPVLCPKCLWKGSFNSYLEHAVKCRSSQATLRRMEWLYGVLIENNMETFYKQLKRLMNQLGQDYKKQIKNLEVEGEGGNKSIFMAISLRELNLLKTCQKLRDKLVEKEYETIIQRLEEKLEISTQLEESLQESV